MWDPGLKTPPEETGGKGIPWGMAEGLLGGLLCLGPENNQPGSIGSQEALGGEGNKWD